MVDMTIEQKRALALASAALRVEEEKKRAQMLTVDQPAISRFDLARREENIAQEDQLARERPLTPLDYAYNFVGGMIPGMDLIRGAGGERKVSAVMDAAMLGAPQVAMAGIDTVTDFLTGGNRPAPQRNPTFGENLTAQQEERRARLASAPIGSLATEMAVGGLAGAGLGGAAARGAASLFPRAANTGLGMAASQGAAGATEGALYSLATGEGDPTTGAIIGGVTGGLGGLFAPLTGAAAADSARREAAERLFGPQVNALLGRDPTAPVNPADLLQRRAELGNLATVADIDPLYRSSVLKAAGPETQQSMSALISAASQRTRPVDEILTQDIENAIGPSYGAVARQEDRAAIIADARQKYDTAIGEMEQSGFTVDANDLRGTIIDGFALRGVTTSTPAAMRDRMTAELDKITGYRPKRYNKKGELIDAGDPGKPDLTVAEALALKKEFDNMITTSDPTKSIKGETRAAAIDLKNYLNDQLKSNPTFADAARVYATEFDIDNARQFAREVFSPKGEYNADDFAKLYSKMSDLEKQAVARAARDEMQTRFIERPGGTTRLARRVGPTQDAALTKKLDIVFGSAATDQLYDAAMRANAFKGTADVIDEATESAMGSLASGVGGTGTIGSLADVGTVTTQAAQGRATSGATAGAARRLLVGQRQASNQAVQREMLSALGRQGDDADRAIMELTAYLNGTAPPRMMTGTGAAIGGATSVGISGREGRPYERR
jgi:hypothetical protein